jgi:hypothetical protein
MKVLIVGVPSSGKSTFIAALRHLFLANQVQTDLELTALADDEAHLNRLEKEWLLCKPMERTKPATEAWVEFSVRNRVSGAEATLVVPDLRGEAFEMPACSGQCLHELHEALLGCAGILLFTNADNPDDDLLIDDVSDILDAEVGAPEDHARRSAPGAFKPQDMPEEVKVVEFLQMANRRPAPTRPRKLAVIVSAWDVVMGVQEPNEWLRTRRPLLSQFLESNGELWDVRVYGVSAQGGRLPGAKDQLVRVELPSKRIQIVGHDAQPHDLSAPLSWLMMDAR